MITVSPVPGKYDFTQQASILYLKKDYFRMVYIYNLVLLFIQQNQVAMIEYWEKNLP